MRNFILIGLIFQSIGCGSPNIDPATPDGAHNRFVQAFGQKDYKAVYELLTSDTKTAFHEYLNNTREVVIIIRSKYPDALKDKAINDLGIPFKQDTFTYREIGMAESEEDVFIALCRKMFSSKDETPSLMQKFGTKVQSVDMEGTEKAIIRTLANETLIYIKESDQHWRTAEIFGVNFRELVLVSRQNLEITKTNVDIFSK